ncbi:ABC transporter permease [Methylocella sp. CPCC 101449]|uniref:ABC transporter permease n=1 Tax=Methylocella sp. CPCC 101449 TaxID=2987531 RepID=UPI00288FCF74|nr:ABC transporter permease [Methylocella sp. CPCC 101449]MDT2022560.1 ABC transporter permease [Methylocella sp. CPCC 101449]
MKTDFGAIGFKVLVVLLYLFLVAPLLMVVLTSFGSDAVESFPPKDFSLIWYWKALSEPSFMAGLRTSLTIAALATLIATPLGAAAAFGIHRGRFPGRNALQALLLAPLLVPGIVIGIALLVAFSAIDFGTAWQRLLFGHVLVILPYSTRTTLAALVRLDPSLEEAAALFGASRWQTLVHVTLPSIAQGIMAGAIFGFILSFDEAAVSLFLIDVDTTTLPIAIMSHIEYSVDPSVTALSSMLILATLLLTVVLERLFGLRRVLGAS